MLEIGKISTKCGELEEAKLSGAALEEVSLSPASLKKIQKRLVDLKFLSGTADGIFGADTRAAIRNYQASIGHLQDSFLTAQERTMLLEPTLASTTTSSPKEAPVAASKPSPQTAAALRPSMQDPQITDRREPEANIPDRASAQTDQQSTAEIVNPPDRANPSASVEAERGIQEKYFIAGALLAVVSLAFAAIFVFIRLRRRSSRTTDFANAVAIDPSVEVSEKQPVPISPYFQANAPLAPDPVGPLHLKEGAKS
jgi:Putative peptidoglycan binding domain